MNSPTCRECKYHGIQVDATKKLTDVCRRHAPKTTHIIVPQGQGFAVQIFAGFPPIDAGEWCGEFEARITLAS